MSLVTYEVDGPVALIGLNRPNKRNATNEALIAELTAAIERAGDEADAGVLFGHGNHFCAGLDLAEALDKYSGKIPPPRKRKGNPWHDCFDLLARGPIPYVAALHGAVVGGGFELASAAHIRVADESAFFALPEGQRGIFVGGGGTVRIQRIIGYSAMADMMLTGRVLDVREAERLQVVRYVVPPGGALEKARELAARIAGNTADTNWKITNVLPRVNDLSHSDGLFMEYLTTQIGRTPEAAARLRQFIEGKAPRLIADSKKD